MSLDAVREAGFSNLDLFLGNTGGCIGEVSALAIIIGGLFLIFRSVISAHIPVAFIATVFVLGFIWGGLDGAVFHICAGGVMLGAFFCATDYVTSPTLPAGKIIFGIGCGLFTMLIRIFGSYPEGVSFAILLMSIVTPYIDRICERMMYPAPKKAKGGE
ncbi:MAG: RnfABCDGE type electron transport complex subunit D [Anaerovoracaceae bacterium]